MGAVQRGRRGGRLNKKPKSAPHSLNSQPTTCTRCGRTPLHNRQLCPARDAICCKCSKRGHFQVVCRSTAKVGEVHQDDPNEFLGGVDTWDIQRMKLQSDIGHFPSICGTCPNKNRYVLPNCPNDECARARTRTRNRSAKPGCEVSTWLDC